MFENIYGLSCVENQVLAQLKLKGIDISVLYQTSNISFEKLFNQMVIIGEKPEYFSLIPRIQDSLKELGVISLDLVTTDNMSKIIDAVSDKHTKVLVKINCDFVRNKLYARGFRPDHYVYVERTDEGYILFNDIPETTAFITKPELETIYEGNYFQLKILRSISDTDLNSLCMKKNDEQINNPSFFCSSQDLDKISDIGIKIRNFFWIYKVIMYRLTELNSSAFVSAEINEKRSLIDNLFSISEYYNLKKITDVSKYYELIIKAYNIDAEIKRC